MVGRLRSSPHFVERASAEKDNQCGNQTVTGCNAVRCAQAAQVASLFVLNQTTNSVLTILLTL